MTTMTADVNEAFAGEKANQASLAYERRAAYERRLADFESGKTQAEMDARLAARVAAGEIEMISTDRYRVLAGYDRNETFRVQRATRPGEVALVLPEHGLDELAGGRVALYSAVPAWHGLGQVIPGGVSGIDDVLKLAGLDYDQELVPVQYTHRGVLHTCEDAFVNVRSDTSAKLGVIGHIWRPVQARKVFEFLEDLVGQFGVTWESAGAVRGGARMFVSMRLPGYVSIDAGGINDQIIPFIVAIDDRTGNAKFLTVTTPWRPVCGNTERFAVRDAWTSWGTRHSGDPAGRVEEARRQLQLSVSYYAQFGVEETTLAQTDTTIDEFRALIAGLWPEPEGRGPGGTLTGAQQANIARRNDGLMERFELESARLGTTLYASERAVTGWADNVAPRRATPDKMAAARATAVIEGYDDDLKSRAHARLLTLTRR